MSQQDTHLSAFPRHALLPTLTLEWIAGFVDGEGCISIPAARGYPRLIVTNTNLTILRSMRAFFGGAGNITQKRRGPGERGVKPCWQWICWNRHARTVLVQLRPHLILKAAEADLAFEFYETSRPHGAVKGRVGNTPLSPTIKRRRADIARRAREAKCV